MRYRSSRKGHLRKQMTQHLALANATRREVAAWLAENVRTPQGLPISKT